jgi:hypothetical protein
LGDSSTAETDVSLEVDGVEEVTVLGSGGGSRDCEVGRGVVKEADEVEGWAVVAGRGGGSSRVLERLLETDGDLAKTADAGRMLLRFVGRGGTSSSTLPSSPADFDLPLSRPLNEPPPPPSRTAASPSSFLQNDNRLRDLLDLFRVIVGGAETVVERLAGEEACERGEGE